MKQILCGYMGCGKSQIGKKLAQKTQLPFLDLDLEIEGKEEQKINDLFAQKGEIYFRKREMEVLKNLLNQKHDFVLSLGGGTPCYGQNLKVIQNSNSRLVYLKLPVSTLTNRLWEAKNDRPLIRNIKTKEKLEEYVRKHLFERRFYYLQSDLNLDLTQYQDQGEIVQKLAE